MEVKYIHCQSKMHSNSSVRNDQSTTGNSIGIFITERCACFSYAELMLQNYSIMSECDGMKSGLRNVNACKLLTSIMPRRLAQVSAGEAGSDRH
jgi:hypothetical protein